VKTVSNIVSVNIADAFKGEDQVITPDSYSSKQCVVGIAASGDCASGKPDDAWGGGSEWEGCTSSELDVYTQGQKTVYYMHVVRGICTPCTRPERYSTPP
jgi:hypothetical protein